MIVLDPPRLATSRDNMRRAMAAYHRINYLAIRMLEPEVSWSLAAVLVE